MEPNRPKWTHILPNLHHWSNPRKLSTSKWRVALALAASKASDTTRRPSIRRRFAVGCRQSDYKITDSPPQLVHLPPELRDDNNGRGRVEMEEPVQNQTPPLVTKWALTHVDPVTTKRVHTRLRADPGALLTHESPSSDDRWSNVRKHRLTDKQDFSRLMRSKSVINIEWTERITWTCYSNLMMINGSFIGRLRSNEICT
jgi:hypothetical protein